MPWIELVRGSTNVDLARCVFNFNNVTRNASAFNPHTVGLIKSRFDQKFSADPMTNGVADAAELRMFRVFDYTSSDPGGISIALDRTIKRIAKVATRDHWCITIGLNDKWPAATSAEVSESAKTIYPVVKTQLKEIQAAGLGTNANFKLALIWHVRDAGNDENRLSDTSLVDAVMKLLLADEVPLTPDPRNGGKVDPEPAYAHFAKYLNESYPDSAFEHYLRFVEVGRIL
jgi:hypothetical protein